MKPFAINDRVAYSIQFLKSIFEPPTSPMYYARGTIIVITDLDIAIVKWDCDPDADLFPVNVHTENLAHVGPNGKFCNID